MRCTYEYRGRTLSRSQILAEFGISYSTLWNRLARGWSIERAIETPIAKQTARSGAAFAPAEREAFAEALTQAPEIFAPAERQAVHTVMVEGLSVARAASDLGVQYNTISVRLDKARAALAAWLERRAA
jgi:DNA-directed RNA polymerase specialized sigma24 family protein